MPRRCHVRRGPRSLCGVKPRTRPAFHSATEPTQGAETTPPVRPATLSDPWRASRAGPSAPQVRVLRASPCRGPASTGFPFGAPPAAVKVTLAVPVHGSWADRFIEHDPRSARGLILPSLIDARHFPPRPGSVPGPQAAFHLPQTPVLSEAGRSTSAPAGDRIEPAPVSPSRAHSICAGQRDRTLVPTKIGVCTLTVAAQRVQLHGGYTKDTQVQP